MAETLAPISPPTIRGRTNSDALRKFLDLPLQDQIDAHLASGESDRLRRVLDIGRGMSWNPTCRNAIFMQLVDVATSLKLLPTTKDGRDVVLVDAKATVEAAKLIMAYDLGTPEYVQRKLQPAQLKPGQTLLEAAMDVYRMRLESGEMTDTEFSEMVKILLAIEREKAILFLKALGDKVKGLGDEKVATLMDAFGKDPQAFMSGQAQLPTIEIPPVDEEKFGGK